MFPHEHKQRFYMLLSFLLFILTIKRSSRLQSQSYQVNICHIQSLFRLQRILKISFWKQKLKESCTPQFSAVIICIAHSYILICLDWLDVVVNKLVFDYYEAFKPTVRDKPEMLALISIQKILYETIQYSLLLNCVNSGYWRQLYIMYISFVNIVIAK